jgi:uncharacterized protein YjbJ (UPF0337 family)
MKIGNTHMYNESTKSDWNEIKGKLKGRFGKLTDETIESMKGSLDTLSAKLQSAYGYAKEQADKEYSSFKATLHTATEPEKKSVVEENRTPTTEGSKKVA